jgi:adenine-specific DNA-methyltransferase
MIKYIGSKRLLVPLINQIARQAGVESACDMFAGTTRVGQGLKQGGLHVLSNDLASYSEVMGLAFIQATQSNVDRERLAALLDEMNQLPGKRGYFTKTFCEEARFFQPENGERVDAIRDRIDTLQLSRLERGILLTSLMLAADRVDSTCGVQMAYVKKWAARSFKPLSLEMPAIVPGPSGTVRREDAVQLAGSLRDIDLVYLDPPYNQHSYFSNYHIWETLIRWDEPEPYGVAMKRVDCKTTKSDFNSKRRAWDAFSSLIEKLQNEWLVVSFNNEGFHSPEAVLDLLSTKGSVASVAVDFKRYVGAQIGIHNPSGERVGEVSHLRNQEIVWVVGPSEEDVQRAVANAGLATDRVLTGDEGSQMSLT